MREVKSFETVLRQVGIFHFGVCAFSSLSLLPTRSAKRLPAGARSVIVCLFPYYTGEENFERRNLARYAIGEDYHEIVGQMLRCTCEKLATAWPEEEFMPFVDASPISEVQAANLAGLGVIGRNGQLISPRFGSYVFLGEIVTTLALRPSEPVKGGCLDCGRCTAACPTGALHPDGTVDADRCRSAITQKKQPLTTWEEQQIREGGLLWGCDCCTDACPLNQKAQRSDIPAFYQNLVPYLDRTSLGVQHPKKACNYRPLRVLQRNFELLYPQEGPEEQ